MKKLPKTWSGIAAPLLVDNVDTDTIIPSREMRSTGRDGLADGLFAPWRYSEADSRTQNSKFVLNQDAFRSAAILASGENFGCGSSREHAVWALVEYGITAIIAISFAPIFRANCLRNGIVPIALSRELVEQIAGEELTINLAEQTVLCDGAVYPFDINPEAKHMLLQGVDAIDLTLGDSSAIDTWTKVDRTAHPWVYLDNTAGASV